MARTQQLSVQVDTSTVYECHHPPVASSSLSIILVHKCLRSNGACLCRELACLRVASLSDFGRVYKREPDPDTSDIKCVSIHDVSHSIRKTSRCTSALGVCRATIGIDTPVLAGRCRIAIGKSSSVLTRIVI